MKSPRILPKVAEQLRPPELHDNLTILLKFPALGFPAEAHLAVAHRALNKCPSTGKPRSLMLPLGEEEDA